MKPFTILIIATLLSLPLSGQTEEADVTKFGASHRETLKERVKAAQPNAQEIRDFVVSRNSSLTDPGARDKMVLRDLLFLTNLASESGKKALSRELFSQFQAEANAVLDEKETLTDSEKARIARQIGKISFSQGDNLEFSRRAFAKALKFEPTDSVSARYIELIDERLNLRRRFEKEEPQN